MKLVTIPSINVEIEVDSGEKLARVLESNDLPIKMKCRVGACGACRLDVIKFSQNLSPRTPMEEKFFTKFPGKDSHRLGCQCRVLGDVIIDEP